MKQLASNTKIFNYLLSIIFVNTIAICFLDKDYITASMYPMYLKIQGFTAILTLVLFAINNVYKFKPEILLAYFIYVLAYGCIGQFFIPSSYVTVIISLFTFAVFLDIYVVLFCIISFIFSALMIVCIWFANTSYSTEIFWSDKFKTDASQTIILMSIFIMVIQYIRYKEKLKTQVIESKLLNLGNQTLFMIHDLKNKITPPLNNIVFLNKQITKKVENDPLMKEVGNDIETDLNDIKDYVMSINQNNAFKTDVKEIVLEDLLQSIKNIYKSKISDITFTVVQKQKLTVDNHIINTLLSNIVMNAHENFCKNNINNKEIKITLEKDVLKISDNGGGFSAEAIKNFNTNSFFTDKTEGSGIGFFILKSYAESLKWKVNLYNDKNNNAIIEFKIKKGRLFYEY